MLLTKADLGLLKPLIMEIFTTIFNGFKKSAIAIKGFLFK